jgi:citrate synthase
MSRPKKPIKSDIGWSTADRISIFGKDLPSEILGHLNLGDMGFLEIKGRLPDANESKMFNAMVVCLAEHGITPSAIAARMTYMGAPEAMQAAVAAGLCGLGSVFVGSTETCAKMLVEALPDPEAKVDLAALAARTVADFRGRKQIVPGVGHPIHKPVDPRTPRLFELAKETGFSGAYVELIQLISAEAEKASGKSLPINATGAIGAICCEMGFDWKICRGLGVMARAVGLVGHLLEESRNPMAGEIWHRVEDEASEHVRPK